MAATTGPARRGRGFRTAASLVERRIRDAGQARGFSATRLLTHWAEIVGADIARMARPAKVTRARGGGGATLSLVCSGAAAPLIEMQAPRIVDRVNACYGYAAIARIRVVQTAPDGFAEPTTEFRHAAADPEIDRRARDAAAGITDDGLREALGALARNVLSRS